MPDSIYGVGFGNQPINNQNPRRNSAKENELQEKEFVPQAENGLKNVDPSEVNKYSEYLAMVNSFNLGQNKAVGSKNVDLGSLQSNEEIIDFALKNWKGDMGKFEAMMEKLDKNAEVASKVSSEFGLDKATSNALGMIAVTKDVNNADVVIQE